MDLQNYLPHFVLPARVWGAFTFCKLDPNWKFCFPKTNFSGYHLCYTRHCLSVATSLLSALGVTGPEEQRTFGDLQMMVKINSTLMFPSLTGTKGVGFHMLKLTLHGTLV